jgi:penicillin amidase
MDVGNWDACIGISPPGRSGILGSDHYSDMAHLWLKGEYVPLFWSREKVEENKVLTLNIRPNNLINS